MTPVAVQGDVERLRQQTNAPIPAQYVSVVDVSFYYHWMRAEHTPDLMHVLREALTTIPSEPQVTVDEFLEWLESEDFGADPTRLRREAWGQ